MNMQTRNEYPTPNAANMMFCPPIVLLSITRATNVMSSRGK